MRDINHEICYGDEKEVRFMQIFSMDSVFYRFISKIGNLMILNFLFIICSLPIFTIGASITAMYAVLFQMIRNEEGYIAKKFFLTFRDNLKQSTAIWIIMLLFGGLFYCDILISDRLGGMVEYFFKIIFLVIGIIYISVLSYIFAIQSRFQNKIMNMFKNSFWMAMGYLPFTISILVIKLLPIYILYIVPNSIAYIIPIAITIGFSGIYYCCAFILNHIFKNYIS